LLTWEDYGIKIHWSLYEKEREKKKKFKKITDV